VSFRKRLEWQWICACVLARGVRARDAEDVAQEVVIAADQAIKKAEHELGLHEGQLPHDARRALLRGILRGQAREYRQAAARGDVLEMGSPWEDVPDTAPNAEEQALANTAVVAVRDALAELRETAPEHHAVLVGFEIDELAMDRIAAALGIPASKAWNWLRMGREALRKILRWSRKKKRVR
jgi:RNA polymerase sigma factor (sigma-70 family)